MQLAWSQQSERLKQSWLHRQDCGQRVDGMTLDSPPELNKFVMCAMMPVAITINNMH